jgi:RNA polymerase sigma factor (sigma-70 family)
MIEDSDLLFAKCCADDLPSYREKLFSRFQESLRQTVAAVLKRHTGQPSVQWTGDDLTQDVFAGLFANHGAKLRTFRGQNGCSLETWPRTVAARHTLNALRRPYIFVQGLDDNLERLPDYQRNTADQDMINNEAVSLIREAVEQFPDMDRLIFRLIFEDEVGYEAAAAVCRMTKGALYTRVSRIKERLRHMVHKAGYQLENRFTVSIQ